MSLFDVFIYNHVIGSKGTTSAAIPVGQYSFNTVIDLYKVLDTTYNKYSDYTVIK